MPKSIKKSPLLHIFIVLLLSQLTACSYFNFFEQQDGPPNHTIDVSKIPNAVPKVEPKSRYGNKSPYFVLGKRYTVLKSAKGYQATGIASWYGTKFNHHKTSNNEYYDMFKMTAANKTLPIPTYVKVINLENGKQIIVKINDRGPFEKNRLIDLSYTAAKKLDMLKKGTAHVKIIALGPHHYSTSSKPVIYLQAGAYSHYSNAKHLQQKITKLLKTIPCSIHSVKKINATLYRVQIGPIVNTSIAHKLRTTLQSAGIPAKKI